MRLRLQLKIDYYVGTLLHVVLKPFVIVAGKVLHRQHDLAKCADIVVIKMLGGGSLIIAYPALMAIKQRPTTKRMRMVSSPAVKPFAESLGIFDEILVIRMTPMGLILDSLLAVKNLFLCDAIVDLEVHSRLSTVFALATCARNRVGFYTQDSFWRRYLSTHLLFCNTKNGIYLFYDQVATLFSATVKPFAYYQEMFRRSIGYRKPEGGTALRLSLAPRSSDLAKERMLKDQEWVAILRRRLSRVPPGQPVSISIFGAPSDRGETSRLAALIERELPGAQVRNRAGETALLDSVREVAQSDELFCIDSSLLHYGRLIGIPLHSFWGPTDPSSLLRPWPDGKEEVHYRKIACSPCVHLTDVPPCMGNNICMRLAVDPEAQVPENPPWVVSDQQATRFVKPQDP